jgi:integrase
MNYAISKKPSGIYFVSFEEAGKRRRVSTKTRDAKLARQVARNIVMGNLPAPAPALPGACPGDLMTMGELLAKCQNTVWSPRNVRSQATVKSNVKILTEMVGEVPVVNMTYARLEKLVQDLFARDYAAGTVHRKMCAISKALNQATRMVDAKNRPILSGKVPIPTVVSDNARSRVLSKIEEDAIFKAIRDRGKTQPTRDWKRFGMLIRFLLDTGCRQGEALNTDISRIEERGGFRFVTFPRYTTKNKKPRTLPLTNTIVSSLPYLELTAIDGKIFPLKPATVWYMWNTIRADVSKITPIHDVVIHTMRHTCLTNIAKSGKARIEEISDWAGHSSLQVTMDHYRHLVPEDKLNTLSILNAIQPSLPEVHANGNSNLDTANGASESTPQHS